MKIGRGSSEKIQRALLGLVLIILHGLICGSEVGAAPVWTPKNSVSFHILLERHDYDSGGLGGYDVPLVPSPDKRSFFFVERWGDLACGCNHFKLSVYHVASLIKPRKSNDPVNRLPDVSVVFSNADATRPAMRDIRWETSSTILLTAAEDAGERVVRVSTANGSVTNMTSVTGRIWSAQTIKDSTVFVTRGDTQKDPFVRTPFTTLRGSYLVSNLLGSEEFTESLWVSSGEKSRLIIAGLQYSPLSIAISPDGLRAVAAVHLPDSTEQWKSYPGSDDPRRLAAFILIDLKSGEYRLMLNAPTGAAINPVGTTSRSSSLDLAPQAFWSSDSKHVLLLNTATKPSGSNWNALNVDYDVLTEEWAVIDNLASYRTSSKSDAQHLSGFFVEQRSDGLVQVTGAGPLYEGTNRSYRYDGRRWKLSESDETSTVNRPPPGGRMIALRGATASVEEDMNRPPTVVVAAGRNRIVLPDLNPDLDRKLIRSAQVIKWVERDGTSREGILTLPESLSTYDLIVESYHVRPHKFLPDGSHGQTPIQSLVGRGFATLQIPIVGGELHGEATKDINTPEEGPKFVERIELALAAAFKVVGSRPRHIGLLGFSRSGYQIAYTITRRSDLASAAVILDSFDGGVGQYVLAKADGASAYDYEAVNGGSLWKNKEAWLARSPDFNLDKIKSPVLYTFNGKYTAPMAITRYGLLRGAGAPAEVVLFPESEHQISRPTERIALYELILDWFQFWMRGEASIDCDSRLEQWQKTHP